MRKTLFDALIIENTNPVTATFNCSIGVGGNYYWYNNKLILVFGYLSNQTTINLKFVQGFSGIITGITTATATASITNGIVTGTTITNPGLGYTVAPTIFAETPNLNIESITGFNFNIIEGFSGIVNWHYNSIWNWCSFST